MQGGGLEGLSCHLDCPVLFGNLMSTLIFTPFPNSASCSISFMAKCKEKGGTDAGLPFVCFKFLWVLQPFPVTLHLTKDCRINSLKNTAPKDRGGSQPISFHHFDPTECTQSRMFCCGLTPQCLQEGRGEIKWEGAGEAIDKRRLFVNQLSRSRILSALSSMLINVYIVPPVIWTHSPTFPSILVFMLLLIRCDAQEMNTFIKPKVSARGH